MIKPLGVSERKIMTKLFWNVIKLAPVLVAATFIASNSAFAVEANETSVAKLAGSNDIGQVTSVSQFSDVQPTDWAFQALQSLVERYGCIAGYPGGTFRGNRAMTRYEFAAGVNACLDRVNELIATATADLVRKDDLSALQRLQEEFADELATLRGRVDELDARTTTLEKKQFSTNAKLTGEVIFNLADSFGDESALSSSTLINDPNAGTANALKNPKLDSNTTFSDRVRLRVTSSFTGTDQLQIRIQARNTLANNTAPTPTNTAFTSVPGSAAGTGSGMTRLSFDGGSNNNLEVDKLWYAFNLTDKVRVRLDANNGEFNDNVNNFNPALASDGQGSISRYGRFSPIYRLGAGGAGATVVITPSDRITASVGYIAGGSANATNDAGVGRGLFDGSYAALGQVGFKLNDAISVGATYARTYQNSASGGVDLTGSTGSNLARNPFGSSGVSNVATSANHYGLQASIKPSDKITLGGWVGFANAEAQNTLGSGANIVRKGDNADLFYWAANLAISDFGREGNLLGFTFGQPPKVTSSDYKRTIGTGTTARIVEQRDADTSYHLEAIYRMQLTDRISVTPGLLVIFNPEHNDRNDTIYVGTVRTTFSF
ncbi:S-layer region-like [Rivularia sp. IAM M-261]|nr:S-layer region-like [Rivularia sp. IAM M-261]